MKKIFLLLLVAISATQLWSQDKYENIPSDRNFHIPLIGDKAPEFTAESTNGVINFPGDFGHSWKILFSHPQDFTPVCSSEILELANLQDEFEKLGVKLAIVSTDPLHMHIQWKKALESLNFNSNGPVKINFPIIDDEDVAISKEYGMIHPETNSTKDVRGVFIINPNNIVQAVYFYPMQVGRSTDELLRTVKALQVTSESSVLTPVNWKTGSDLLIPFAPEATAEMPTIKPEDYYSLAWFMWYKKDN